MTQTEFVLIYVGLPLGMALGWLVWRARVILRNAALYGLAIAAVLVVVRTGDAAWQMWSRVTSLRSAPASAPFCVDGVARDAGKPSCWT